jgi:hypothetical protein
VAILEATPTIMLQTYLHKSVILISAFVAPLSQAATPAEVSAAATKAVAFYHSKAAAHGGYVYRYSADFTLREAEGIPGPDTIWIQPPGTPAVGMAMLDAYEVTKDAGIIPGILMRRTVARSSIGVMRTGS